MSFLIFTGEFDYADTENQHRMANLFDSKDGNIALSPYYRSKTLSSWYNSFRNFGNFTNQEQTFPPEDYYIQLERFLSTDVGSQFVEDIVFDDTKSKLLATASFAFFDTLANTAERVDAMQTMRASVNQAELYNTFAYSPSFLYFDGDAVLKEEVMKCTLLSLAAVFVVTLFLIGNLQTALIVLTGVCFSVVDLLGLVHFLSINLHSVSVICLALAVGLTVDFSAHMGLLFLSYPGTKRERVGKALAHLGPALTHSGLTTMVALSVLVVAQSYTFQVLFKMLSLTISLGMFHGMIVVPIILYLIGSESYVPSADKSGV